MECHLLTLFPNMFSGPLSESILKKAQERGLVSIHIHPLRTFTTDKHQITDDTPYGGGIGMVLKIDPIQRALEVILSKKEGLKKHVLLLSPKGRPFSQKEAKLFSLADLLCFICGRYEGVDERIQSYITDEISLGDFILTGGEIAAMAILDATLRFIPGVIGQETAAYEDSFSEGLLEFPQYTRPEVFQNQRVPSVLLSGNHETIHEWRRKESLKRTLLERSDLFGGAILDEKDSTLLQEIIQEVGKGHE